MFGAALKFTTPILIRNTTIYGNVLKSYYSKGLTDREKIALYRSNCMIKENVELYAHEFFKLLFHDYPDYAKLFGKFGCCPEDVLKNDDFIRKHAVGKVFHKINEFVKSIEDPCKAESMMKKLGRKHQQYGMAPEHFKNARKILLTSLEMNLLEKWDAEVEEGWKKATKIMFRGLQNGVKCN